MNWKLILQLSLFGLFMGLGTVYFIPSTVEPICWLAIFIVCAYLIAKNVSEKFFLHGFFVSLVNCVWITASHILLFSTYSAAHQKEMGMIAQSSMATHPRVMMLITGPIVGVVSGLILGLFAIVASKIISKKAA